MHRPEHYAEAHLREIAGQSEPEELTKIGFFYWSAGSPKQALEFMEKARKVAPFCREWDRVRPPG